MAGKRVIKHKDDTPYKDGPYKGMTPRQVAEGDLKYVLSRKSLITPAFRMKCQEHFDYIKELSDSEEIIKKLSEDSRARLRNDYLRRRQSSESEELPSFGWLRNPRIGFHWDGSRRVWRRTVR